MTETSEYRTWCKMLSRCYNENDAKFYRYGARGIRVCDRWRHSFENFFADMGTRPSLDHSIDRRDNDGNYSPDNCRWATRLEQAQNKSNNVLVVLDGEKITLGEAERRLGICVGSIKQHIKNHGRTHQDGINHYVRRRDAIRAVRSQLGAAP